MSASGRSGRASAFDRNSREQQRRRAHPAALREALTAAMIAPPRVIEANERRKPVPKKRHRMASKDAAAD
jgi:hypothetical protein